MLNAKQRLVRVAASVGVAAAAVSWAATARAAVVYGLTDENDLISFDSANPTDLLSASAITGLGGQDLLGIDFRPANGVLYGVGNFGGVFRIDPATGVAVQASALNVPLSGSRFGLDFNPIPDRLRIVSDTGQNLRVNVDTGAVTVDTPLNYGPNQPGATGDAPIVVGAAYTNSFPPSPRTDPATTLYGIDVRSSEDRLVIQSPPNAGVLTVVGPLGLDASSLQGFDIFIEEGSNVGLAALQDITGGVSRLYRINLATGQATLVPGGGGTGVIGGGDLIDGLTVVPIPEPSSAIALLGGAAALALSRRRRQRA